MSKDISLSEKETIGSICRRLDAIIRLLMEEQFQAKMLKKGDQLLVLESVGLSSAEIGQITGQSSKDVASALKKLKKKGTKKDERKGTEGA